MLKTAKYLSRMYSNISIYKAPEKQTRMICFDLTLKVPDVEYTLHENTFLHNLRKRNPKWMKLQVIRGWHKVTFTSDESLALKRLKGEFLTGVLLLHQQK